MLQYFIIIKASRCIHLGIGADRKDQQRQHLSIFCWVFRMQYVPARLIFYFRLTINSSKRMTDNSIHSSSYLQIHKCIYYQIFENKLAFVAYKAKQSFSSLILSKIVKFHPNSIFPSLGCPILDQQQAGLFQTSSTLFPYHHIGPHINLNQLSQIALSILQSFLYYSFKLKNADIFYLRFDYALPTYNNQQIFNSTKSSTSFEARTRILPKWRGFRAAWQFLMSYLRLNNYNFLDFGIQLHLERDSSVSDIFILSSSHSASATLSNTKTAAKLLHSSYFPNLIFIVDDNLAPSNIFSKKGQISKQKCTKQSLKTRKTSFLVIYLSPPKIRKVTVMSQKLVFQLRQKQSRHQAEFQRAGTAS